MHSTGIGGGGLMLVYTRKDKSIDSYDYRETAPGKAREDMFVNEPDKSKSGNKLSTLIFHLYLKSIKLF